MAFEQRPEEDMGKTMSMALFSEDHIRKSTANAKAPAVESAS